MFRFPFGTTQELNLDWFLEQWEIFKQEAQTAFDGIDHALDDEIQRVEDAMTDLYAARDAAIAAKNDALDYAQSANSSAIGASQSAQNSAASAVTSAQQAQSAAQQAQNAAQSATSAQSSATNAGTSAGNALTQAQQSEAWATGEIGGVHVPPSAPQNLSNAKQYAMNAGLSANAANTAKNDARVYSQDSKAWATGIRNGQPVTSEDETYQNNAKYYAESIAGDATAAAQSAAAAATSEANAASVVAGADGEKAQAMIAPLENSSTASAFHGIGDYFRYMGVLYVATADIAIGDTITPGTNCVVAALAEAVTKNSNTIPATAELFGNFEDVTRNLLNPETITEGYFLVNDEPRANSSYYYSDYIKIGMTVFVHSQAGSVSNQITCYDKNKKSIGIIDYNNNTDHFIEKNAELDGSLRYRIIYPLDGTVYIRVNGGTRRPKLVTPFFSPMDYGATAQNLEYNKPFKKHGYNIAMFGDSITLGRNGSGNDIISKNIPWLVQELTKQPVDNYGEGSMGWCSRQYNPEIAYEKISATDLSKYQVITLCYGVNDTAAALGVWNSSDENTICGQINKCIKYIASVNNKAKIILIAPFNTGSGSFPDWRYGRITGEGWSRQDLSDAEEEICNYYHIPFISQNDSPVNGFGIGTPESVRTYQFLGTDNVHPTADGYDALGHWLAGKLAALF